MHTRYLITLSSPIAIRTDNGTTKLLNVVEAYIEQARLRDERCLRVTKWYDSATQTMQETKLVDVMVKASNIRSKQEVR